MFIGFQPQNYEIALPAASRPGGYRTHRLVEFSPKFHHNNENRGQDLVILAQTNKTG
jgi:hypothetical protein